MSAAYHALNGTIRAKTPAETLAWLRPLYAQVGITRIADLSNLDPLHFPVVGAVRPLSKNLSVALGKGMSLELAEISAVMESMEGYHAENLPPPDLHGSYAALMAEGLPVIDPKPFVKGAMQAATIETYPLDWIKAEALGSGAIAYIPYTLCNLNLTLKRPESYYFQVSSNGVAAGNTLAEATCHALYELIERDAFYEFGISEDTARQARRLNLASINSEAFKALWQLIQAKQLSLKIWDITHSAEVPTYHCCLFEETLSPIFFSSGSGCHLSREIALLRAVTEAIQARNALISGTRDDIYPSYYLYQQKLRQERDRAPAAPEDMPHQWTDCVAPEYASSFDANIRYLLTKMPGEVYRLDLSRPELNIPVVFTIATNLQFTGTRT